MEDDPETPLLRARLENAFPEFGGDMLRVLGIGEFTAGTSPIIGEPTPAWENGTRLVAEAGWRNENHSLTPSDFMTIVDGWERVDEALDPPGITELGWVLAHAPFITRDYADKLGALGAGVSVLGGWRWLSGTEQQNGPPFRMLVDSGIPVGMSSDGMQISPMNPWIGLYYVVTGRNARGEPINAGQTLERGEALRLYTAANGWFLGEEDAARQHRGRQVRRSRRARPRLFRRVRDAGRGHQGRALAADGRRRPHRARQRRGSVARRARRSGSRRIRAAEARPLVLRGAAVPARACCGEPGG